MFSEGNSETGSDSENGSLSAHLSRSKHHAGYWKSRIFHRSKAGYVSPEWSIRLQHAGRRETFSLFTANAVDAGVKAREISAFLEANGWQETIAKYKRKKSDKHGQGTVGAFLAAAEARSSVKPGTFAGYAEKLRQIVAGIANIEGDKTRYDYVHGGSAAWRKRIHDEPISCLTHDSIRLWHSKYLRRAEDPLKRRSTERTAASIIRMARCLFRGSPADPFAGIKVKDPAPTRYRSQIDATVLMDAGEAELKAKVPQAFLALSLCLWAGLRKKEADLLEWSNVDLVRKVISVKRTQFFDPKTEESQREIDIPDRFAAALAYFKESGGRFVLRGRAPKPKVLYQYYRAETTWRKLNAWLKKKGVSAQKAVHALRKESGSLIAQQFGIEAARQHLGHRDIQTTSAHYVSKKGRREVSLSLLPGGPDNPGNGT